MAIEVLYDPERNEGCLCSAVTGDAFGPVLAGLTSREELESYARATERHLAAGGSHEDIPMLLNNLQRAAHWPIESQMQCLHCDAVVDPMDVKQAMDAASWHLFEPTVRAACPACGQGDGDFVEADVCGHCHSPIDDVAAHIGQCPAVPREDTDMHRKPPMPSVRTVLPAARRRFA